MASEAQIRANRINGKKGGRKKGQLGLAALDKLAQREFLRKRVAERMGELIDAQITNALGIHYLVTRDKRTGKFIRVGPAMAGQVNEKTIQVWQKDPSVHAFADLLNRTIDKPAEQPVQLEHTGRDGEPIEIIIRKPWAKKS